MSIVSLAQSLVIDYECASLYTELTIMLQLT